MRTVRVFLLMLAATVLLTPATALAKRHDMRFTDVQVEAEDDSPRACFVFTRKLGERGSVRYENYLRFEPEFKAAITARGNRLCVEGFEHGKIYSTTLLKGLPDATGRQLPKTEQFNISVPDRQPSLSFSGASYILPGKGERNLPLNSVNVASAEIRILRINDRNLMDEINQGRISTLMSRWDTSRIETLDGEEIWRGVIDIDMKKNRTVPVAVPIGDMLGDPEPGIYVVMAIPKEKRQGYIYYEATQWVIVSDIGISSYSGGDGLRVFLRSLQDAGPLAGRRVQLIARNNEILGTARTDAEGAAHFAPGLLRGKGGARPGAVMAFGDGEFNFLDLTRPAFDLTDRGVGGRQSPGPIDAFLYTDRGVYRPGETANIVALIRSDKAFALADTKLTLKLFRPDGAEHDTVAFNDGGKGGAYHLSLPLSKSARTGRWTAQAYVDPKGPPVGTVVFQVEDFVPERMEVALEAAAASLRPGVANSVEVTARFLYGAPGAGLTVEGEIVLQQDMNPYPDFKGYQFGLVQEEWRPRREELAPLKTDDEGRASLPVLLADAPDSTRPLKALVRISVAEVGGRAVSRTIGLPVRSIPGMIGILPNFDGGALEKGQDANFKVILVDPDGATISGDGLIYELYEEQYRYNWFYRNSGWDYTVLIDENSIESSELRIAADRPAALAFRLDWGRYRLEVHDPRTGAATSVRFRIGWYGVSAGDANVPDKLEVSLDKDSYRVGDIAKVHIRPPFAGRLLLTVAGSKIYETRGIDIAREGGVVELPVSEDWDAGAYVTATVYRAAGADQPHKPSRAIGVAWLARDFSDRILDVAVDAPERIMPRQTIEVGVTVSGAAAGETVWVTLAAVDEGILQLTGFKSPAPADWYYGKRRLGVELRDDYGRLIQGATGGTVRFRQGGDAAADRNLGGLDASSIKTVSLFSGIVKVGPDGKAVIPLDVPDFNGRLRLMAVAWSGSMVGSAKAPLIVRDPVVSQMTLPRFLAPGDKSRLTLALHNVDGPAGRYTITMAAGGATRISGGKREKLRLDSDQRETLTFTLEGGTAGVGSVALTIKGPDGLLLERDWEIAVRPAQAVITKRLTSQIQPGKRHKLTADVLAEFVPGTAEALVTLSSRPEMDLANLLKSLSRYPYGCVEQTTSRALPLLYVGELAESLGIVEDELALRNTVQRAIRRIFTMQRSDGSFGLWSSRSNREEWLTAYAMDFLTQAKELKYAVPDYPYQRGLKWMAQSVSGGRYSKSSLPSRVYALYVLSRAGKARLAELRYVHDVYLQSIPTALGRAQLGAALAQAGDKRRAAQAFAAAKSSWSRPSRFWKDWWFWDYGTSLRDMAGTVYLASWSNQAGSDWPELAQTMADTAARSGYLSTQEKAWLALAAREMGESGPIRVAIDGKAVPERTKPLYIRFDEAALAGGRLIANQGDKPVWQGITLTGVPRDELPAERKGFVIIRGYYTLDGKRADLSQVRQGDTLVAVINGEATTRLDHQALIVDLLPAGFEIENSRLEGGRGTDEMRWLPELSKTRNVELRDDRFVAALDLDSWGKREFTLAYVVRAVSPGEFRAPAVYVEDMYKPNYFARSRMGKVTILPVE